MTMQICEPADGSRTDGAPKRPAPSGKPLRLLQAVPNRVYNRLIARYPYRTDRDYAFFYHEAANRLASTYTGKTIDDTILIPFLMLYRHAFELQLKNCIRYLAGNRCRQIISTRSRASSSTTVMAAFGIRNTYCSKRTPSATSTCAMLSRSRRVHRSPPHRG